MSCSHVRGVAVLASLFLSTTALADIAPDNASQCTSLKAGAVCRTDDGKVGTCVATLISRPDYSEGPPPKMTQVEVLLCVASASARSAVPSLSPFALAGAVLAMMLAVLGARWLQGRKGHPA
jgi:hypothetical protein